MMSCLRFEVLFLLSLSVIGVFVNASLYTLSRIGEERENIRKRRMGRKGDNERQQAHVTDETKKGVTNDGKMCLAS